MEQKTNRNEALKQISGRPCLGITAVALMLGVSSQYVRKQAQAGELKGVPYLSTIRFSVDDVLNFMTR